MIFDNSVKVAFLISLACHSCLIITLPGINAICRRPDQKPLEITYYKISQRPKLTRLRPAFKQPVKRVVKQQKRARAPKEKKKFAQKQQEKIKKDIQGKAEEIVKIKKQRPVDMAQVRQATARASKTPAYLDYGQAVHKRISDVANKKYGRFHYDGEVFVSFAIFSDGTLAGITIIDDKSSPDPRLKRAAIDSIKIASPFDPFPEGLDFPQLSFNVVISFER